MKPDENPDEKTISDLIAALIAWKSLILPTDPMDEERVDAIIARRLANAKTTPLNRRVK